MFTHQLLAIHGHYFAVKKNFFSENKEGVTFTCFSWRIKHYSVMPANPETRTMCRQLTAETHGNTPMVNAFNQNCWPGGQAVRAFPEPFSYLW